MTHTYKSKKVQARFRGYDLISGGAVSASPTSCRSLEETIHERIQHKRLNGIEQSIQNIDLPSRSIHMFQLTRSLPCHD